MKLPIATVDGQTMPLRLGGPSLLARFRASDTYRRLVRARKQVTATLGADFPQTASEDPEPANLTDRAEAAIDYLVSGGDVRSLLAEQVELLQFADNIMAMLVDKGFDDNLVEVQADGSGLLVFLDDRITPKVKDILDRLRELSAVELVARPDDNPQLGTYVLRVVPSMGTDVDPKLVHQPQDPEDDETPLRPNPDQSRGPVREAVEVFTPASDDVFTPIREAKKPRSLNAMIDRLLATLKAATAEDPELDKKQALRAAKAESLIEAEGNLFPKQGDVILDTQAKQSFKVLAILGNEAVRVKGFGPRDKEQVIRASTLERGLATGAMRNISLTEHASGEGLDPTHYCFNCLTPLAEKSPTFFHCVECAFEAEFDAAAEQARA